MLSGYQGKIAITTQSVSKIVAVYGKVVVGLFEYKLRRK